MLIDVSHNLLIGGVFSLLVGALLGGFYFLGLWWTVRQLSTSHNVALFFLVSLLVRTSIVTVGFYFLMGNNWTLLVLGLVGFMVVRGFAIRYVQPNSDVNATPDSEIIKRKYPHAP